MPRLLHKLRITGLLDSQVLQIYGYQNKINILMNIGSLVHNSNSSRAVAREQHLPQSRHNSPAARCVSLPRKKAFISFHFLCRIGAFQWVTANPNKKIFLCLSSRLRLCAECFSSLHPCVLLAVLWRGAFFLPILIG